MRIYQQKSLVWHSYCFSLFLLYFCRCQLTFLDQNCRNRLFSLITTAVNYCQLLALFSFPWGISPFTLASAQIGDQEQFEIFSDLSYWFHLTNFKSFDSLQHIWQTFICFGRNISRKSSLSVITHERRNEFVVGRRINFNDLSWWHRDLRKK